MKYMPEKDKILGSFKDGQLLYAHADHPDHKDFDALQHLRAASKHKELADQHEQNKDYLRSYFHRAQRASHMKRFQNKTKGADPRTAQSVKKSGRFRQATDNKGANPLRETMTEGRSVKHSHLSRFEKAEGWGEGDPNKGKVVQAGTRFTDKPKSQPEDQSQEQSPQINHQQLSRFLETIRGHLSSKGPDYNPAHLGQDFKNKLADLTGEPKLKKAQYAKTDPPEARKQERKIKQKQKQKKEEIAGDMKSDFIQYRQAKFGKGKYGQAFPAEPKKTARSVKDKKQGEVLNKPKEDK